MSVILVLNATSDSGKMVLGIGLIVAGQFCNAVQMIVEEIYLKKRSLEPLLVVGMEGLWGSLIMCFVVLPIIYFIPGDDNGSYENAIDALYMIKNSWSLALLIVGYWLSIAFYNFFGLSVAKSLTSVHRTLIDALRTMAVWGVQLVIYYRFSRDLGEDWNQYSWLELAGFLLLLCGTLIYNSILKVQKPVCTFQLYHCFHSVISYVLTILELNMICM